MMESYAIRSEYIKPFLEKMNSATPEEITASIHNFKGAAQSSIMSVDGDTATITINGALSLTGPSPLARFFGYAGTAYTDIVSAAKTLSSNPDIKNVNIAMNTPGGGLDGMDEARQAIADLASKKNVITENHGMIASAGYYLATAANTIVSMSPMSLTGSIGVILAGISVKDAMEREGIKQVRIVSKNAPNKSPDPTSNHGEQVLQDEINALERIFISKVAQGRGTTEQDVIDNFGQGGMLVSQDPDPSAKDAVRVGMIDGMHSSTTQILKTEVDPKPNAVASIKPEGAVMDSLKLKAEHPALYSEIMELGAKQERSRVSAHIKMGVASGDTELSMKCILDGVEHTAETNAEYMAAQMTKNAIKDRKADSEGAIDVSASDVESEADLLDAAVAAELTKKYGEEAHA